LKPGKWSNLFQTRVADEDRRLYFIQPALKEGRRVAVCPEQEIQENNQTWYNTLVGYVLGLTAPRFENMKVKQR